MERLGLVAGEYKGTGKKRRGLLSASYRRQQILLYFHLNSVQADSHRPRHLAVQSMLQHPGGWRAVPSGGEAARRKHSDR